MGVPVGEGGLWGGGKCKLDQPTVLWGQKGLGARGSGGGKVGNGLWGRSKNCLKEPSVPDPSGSGTNPWFRGTKCKRELGSTTTNPPSPNSPNEPPPTQTPTIPNQISNGVGQRANKARSGEWGSSKGVGINGNPMDGKLKSNQTMHEMQRGGGRGWGGEEVKWWEKSVSCGGRG